jgi:uroporphyrinogen III methyltransferase / synthase
MGARVLECPVISFAPVEDWAPVDRVIGQLDSYDWLLFTSTNAVDLFMKRVDGAGVSVSVSVAAVGSSTANRIRHWGLIPSLLPDSFRAEGLLEVFPKDLRGKRVLYPRAETARELLPEELQRRGASVDVVTIYRTTRSESGLEKLRTLLLSERIDCFVLTSPSAIHFVAETLGNDLETLLKGVAVAVIGPVARQSAEAAGLKPTIQPDRATVPDLVEAIGQYFR